MFFLLHFCLLLNLHVNLPRFIYVHNLLVKYGWWDSSSTTRKNTNLARNPKTNKMEKSYKRIRRKMEKNEVKRSKLN